MKRIISLLLAAVMLVSAVPTAFAADTNDYSQGTQVVFTAANNESYTITVPAGLNPGQSGTVTLSGTWPDNRTVTVTADKTVKLTNSIKAADTKTLDVTFAGISEAGSNTGSQTFTETVSVSGISNALFGEWSGKFNYNVTTTDEEVPPSENYIGIVSADNTITLNAAPAAGIYTLRYANTGGALDNYADICSLEVTDPATAVSYDDLITENCAPVEATTIAVYNESDEKVGEIALGHLENNLGTKLYSFGALMDVHFDTATAPEDFQRALNHFNNVENVSHTCIAGDLTGHGTLPELEEFKTFVDTYSNRPVYFTGGNHDITPSGLPVSDTLYSFEKITGRSPFYSFTKGNDVFIMVGITSETTVCHETALNWLYHTLEENKDKRCFVFQHILSAEGSGDGLNLYPNTKLDGNTVFESLMEHYPNVTWFHGHSHMKFELQKYSDIANYDKLKGYHSVHIPSVSVPRTAGSTDTSYLQKEEDSEGYVVDVYESGIVLRGRDFVNEKFLPIAQYYLDTTLKSVAANTYVDNTNTINTNETIIDIEISKNSKLDKETGAEDNSINAYGASEFINIEENAEYKIYVYNNFYCRADALFYDENGNYLGWIEGVSDQSTTWNAGLVTATVKPIEGAATMRLRAKCASNATEEEKDKFFVRIVLGEIK